ncbi:hypothetical protein KAR91_41055 [Candidatus Pacearchaeota archaeon]|nr:hypothetical protein [Candidatus Pacearchaeota archaeon]
MSKYYVAYEDKGPSGPCGQVTSVTRCHSDLYVFDDEESARSFIKKVDERIIRSRIMPKITGFWSEAMGNVLKTD